MPLAIVVPNGDIQNIPNLSNPAKALTSVTTGSGTVTIDFIGCDLDDEFDNMEEISASSRKTSEVRSARPHSGRGYVIREMRLAAPHSRCDR